MMAAGQLKLSSSGLTEGAQSTRMPLIAYARDRETLEVLTEVLGSALGPAAEFRIGSIVQALGGLRRLGTPVAALLVDVSGESDPLGALEDLALYVEPGVRVFVIGDVDDIDFYRQITRNLGVHEYLSKPLNRDVVARSLLPVLTGSGAAPARGGRIVSVTGARGGVGATTIAVNLAAQLADRSRHHILLFDANLNSGTAALMLGTHARGGGLREALENPSRVDPLFAERSTPAISDRLHLLAAEEPLDDMIVAADGAMRHLTGILCNRFNFVVTDLPAYPTPLSLELGALAHVKVLVMDPTLPSLRDALRHLALPRGPRQAARPIVVLNRAGLPGALTNKQVADAMGGDVDVIIPWLPKQMKTATTLGEPGVRVRGPFQTAIEELANEILPQRNTSEPRRPWSLMRLRGAFT
jgi:pilus assembly protein CpaE